MESDETTIMADRQRLEYALGNLLDNALTHGAGNVELVGQRMAVLSRSRVRDHGAGFSDSYLAHPFVRFAPTASTGRGTGLGLAIVQAITEAHGGVVSLANDRWCLGDLVPPDRPSTTGCRTW